MSSLNTSHRRFSAPRLRGATQFDAELASGEVFDLPWPDEYGNVVRAKVVAILGGAPFERVDFEIQAH